MNIKTLAVTWFREEDWPRWRAIDPDFQPDYDHWLEKSELAMVDYDDPRYVLEKVMVDPDEFFEWSRVNTGGSVDQQARAAYAGFVVMKKHRTDH